jgi:hypothetical protein
MQMLGDIALLGCESSGIKKKRSCVCCGEAGGKPKGKAAGDMRGLKPYWGNLAVRDYRGLGET